MRSIPIDYLVDLLKQFMQLVPYRGVAGRVRRKGIGKGEEGKEQFVSEGQEPRRRRRLLVFGVGCGRDLVEGAEGAVFALRW